MSNKEKAVTFLKMASSGDVRAAYEKFIATNFRHHNQYYKGDRESLAAGMEEACKNQPNKLLETKYVYEDGPTVITHSLVKRFQADQPDIAVIHIFRFEDGKIVELWDLGQMIEKNSPNENGLF